MCGLPLYTYDHMPGWEKVHRHVAEEITLLCATHHYEKTNGLLPIEQVEAANKDPFNRRAGSSAPYPLHYSGPQCHVNIGSNEFSAPTSHNLAAVLLDEVPIVGFRFEDGHYLLNVLLFDERNELVLRIMDNELVYSAGPWDIEFVGKRLIIRAAPRDIFIDMSFEPPNAMRIDRGRLLLNGIEVYVRPTYALVVNKGQILKGNRFPGAAIIGLAVGDCPRGILAAFRFPGVPRVGIDRTAALRSAAKRMKGRDARPS